MSEEEITLEQAEDIVDNMYQNRFKECNVEEGNTINIGNLSNVEFNELESASILLLRTEISQKTKIDKYKEVLDKIKEILNKMIYEGYAPSSTGSITFYTATGENSEFGTRAKVILELLEEIE